ncbi:hypothetical protein D2A34_16275 [Clostridium chromiireducens]|uniref:Uncharacterized protein n=2 Tax=Clostridium chromiireducens TaxID=225345 RepID=A0A399IL76_9CLOT|nr:hypothetical protein [Clostridium chromiireducens]RII33307.1 hypothetical protein D2A34_16275 [Clostridium chromiireducens]
MKKSIVLIKRNSFILEGEEYNFDKINEIKCIIKNNIKIIVLEEELCVKQFIYKIRKRKIYDFIILKIASDFPQNGDLLYDYMLTKKNKVISIYSIRGAKRIGKLVEGAKNIEIKPIQFLIKEILVSILKNKNFTAKILMKYNEVYYYISFKEGLFNYGFVEITQSLVLDKILICNEYGDMYVDEESVNIISSENKINPFKINIKELINEKIFEKQRFYS